MPFRTGPQSPIGNGSTLTLLGTRPMEEEAALDFYGESGGSWVELVAHIEAEKTPPSMDAATLSRMHARALWKDACVCWYNKDSARVLTHPVKKWARVTFTNRIRGELRDPNKYLHAVAARQSGIWEMIEYAWFGGALANRVLGIHNTINPGPGCVVRPPQRILPIQPCHLAGQICGNPCSGPGEKNYENLSFGFEPAAETTAKALCRSFVGHGSWCGLDKDWSARWAGRSNVSLQELQEGLAQLVRDDFITQNLNSPLYELEIRESLVVKFWEAAVAV